MIKIITIVLLFAFVNPSIAAGERSVFKNTAVEKFNAEDLALMNARVREALVSEKEGEVLTWNNDKSKASGTVTPLGRLTWKGLACRRLQLTTSYGNMAGKGVYKFCEKPAGRWRLVGPEAYQG